MKTAHGLFRLSRLLFLVIVFLVLPSVYVHADEAGGDGDFPLEAGFDISGSFTDPNFKQAVWEWLGNPAGSVPGAFTQQDLHDRMESQEYYLVTVNLGIQSLAGLENFEGTGLKGLGCWGNNLHEIPTLPTTIIHLSCGANDLNSLPNLPSGLKILSCGGNDLVDLPPLPNTLTHLYCDDNYLTNLPILPASLIFVQCHNNYINVFSGPTKTMLDLYPNKLIAPQLGYRFCGTAVGLAPGATRQLTSSDFEKRSTLDGYHWNGLVNGSLEDFTFSSSNNAMATVSPTGLITAHSNGSCSIYALYKGIDSEYTRVVIPVNIGGSTPPIVDIQPPVVTFNNPANNASFTSGQYVAVSTAATDDTGVIQSTLYINNQMVSQMCGSSINYDWDTRGLAPGTYTLKAEAIDRVGHTGFQTISVTINTVSASVKLTSPPPGSSYSSLRVNF